MCSETETLRKRFSSQSRLICSNFLIHVEMMFDPVSKPRTSESSSEKPKKLKLKLLGKKMEQKIPGLQLSLESHASSFSSMESASLAKAVPSVTRKKPESATPGKRAHASSESRANSFTKTTLAPSLLISLLNEFIHHAYFIQKSSFKQD